LRNKKGEGKVSNNYGLIPKLKLKPKPFLAFTGMPLHTFEALRPQFEQAFLCLEQDRKAKPYARKLTANVRLAAVTLFKTIFSTVS
jgi:hypothetical protein